MFANTFQSGFISIFYSVGSNPLQLWDKQVKNGHIRRIVDEEVRSLVLEVSGTNVATTYITCPIKPRLSLGIRLPFLVMIIKNMKKYFTFEIQILDDKDMHRRFRVSNFQSTTKVRPFCTTMPIGLSSGWNQVQFNLADFTKRAYGSTYIETTRVQIHANVRIRRIYFSDILYCDEDLPNEYKLFVPTPGAPSAAAKKAKGTKKESIPKEEKPKPEEELPSGAPPSPAGGEPELREEPLTTPEPPSEPAESDVVVEAPSEKPEEITTTEATTEGGTEATFEEGAEMPPAEAPVAESGDEAAVSQVTEEAVTETPAESEAAPVAESEQDAAVEAEQAPAEETPAEEAPPPEAEAPAEEPAPEAPPAEEEAAA